MSAVIVAEQLTKWYGPRLAVDHVSFTVGAGEIMGLLGPNGSGKTTILRIFTGYLRPSSGTARIAGLDVVADAPAARRRVGYVPEDAPLYLGMGVREFLIFMGRLKGLTRASLGAAVDAATERLRLGPMRTAQIGRLGDRTALEFNAQLDQLLPKAKFVPDNAVIDNFSTGGQVNPAPEAATLLMCGSGILLMVWLFRRSQSSAAFPVGTVA